MVDEATELSRSLNVLANDVGETRAAKGWVVLSQESWEDDYLIPADLALIHSEVSEALEAFRRGDRAAFGGELADVLLRVVHLAQSQGIDLGGEAWAKATRNKDRPHHHGGKRL